VLSNHINITCLGESIDTEMLKKFNENPRKYSSMFQEVMKIGRLKNADAMEGLKSQGDSVIFIDTGIVREIAFSAANFSMEYMSEAYFKAHMQTFQQVLLDIGHPVPDYIILLDASGDRCMENIKKRSRSNESLLEKKYLDSLTREHRNALQHELIKGKCVTQIVGVEHNYATDIINILSNLVKTDVNHD